LKLEFPGVRAYFYGVVMRFRIFIALLLISLSSAAPAALPWALGGTPSLAPMLERVTPAVVNISTSATVPVRESPLFQDPFFRRFFDLPEPRERQRRTQGLGSGVVIDAQRGLVATNAHVIEKADEITVRLQDGRQFKAEIIGVDRPTDIAVIRIPAERLTAIRIGDSDKLRVGDFVVAIGNPFGLNQTVTSGIVSALGRSGLNIEGYEDFIQTDASINPGNSGGALVNLDGELVGINTAILAPSGGNVGIGFAIPVNMARQIAEQLSRHGEVQRGRLGVHIQDLNPELAEAFGVKQTRGALVTKVVPDSPADKSGLKPGDVVIAVNGKRVKEGSDLRNTIGLLRVGQSVALTVLRKNQQLTLNAAIDKPRSVTVDGGKLHPRLAGAQFSNLPSDIGAELDGGVLVKEVKRGSPAWEVGLRDEDIVLSANRRRVSDTEQFAQAVKGADALLFNLRRGDSAFFIVIR